MYLRLVAAIVALGTAAATCVGDVRTWLIVYGVYTMVALVVWNLESKYPWTMERLKKILGVFGVIWLILGLVMVFQIQGTCSDQWIVFVCLVIVMCSVMVSVCMVAAITTLKRPAEIVEPLDEQDPGV